MAYLTYSTKLGPRELPIDRAVIVIGREVGCTICIADEPQASRRHAQVLRRADGEYEVKDLASKNGTYVNSNKSSTAVLRDGDTISIGDVKIVFHK